MRSCYCFSIYTFVISIMHVPCSRFTALSAPRCELDLNSVFKFTGLIKARVSYSISYTHLKKSRISQPQLKRNSNNVVFSNFFPFTLLHLLTHVIPLNSMGLALARDFARTASPSLIRILIFFLTI